MYNFHFKVVGPDNEESDCPFDEHPWVSPELIKQKFTKIENDNYSERTICVNHKRQYLGPLSFWNTLNKWTMQDLQSYTSAAIIRTPSKCPEREPGTVHENFEIC